ncbi:zinc finger protein 91-like [Helicoverpa zea]|uniref:zinc finger protein 91-like n=1 Tax=Helicoverpa zea TaxID=7113 RepID=UPI001F59DAF4|nr:zinc finger protein 91-like [Helicoverpa zea]
MAEASRKRSRKSKIVLRDVALDDEDDIELQLPTKSKKVIIKKEPKKESAAKKPARKTTKINQAVDKSVLDKIKAPIETNIEEPTPRFDINVEIEVETCDDENFYTNDENNDQSTEQIKDVEESSNKIKIKKEIKNVILSRETVIRESNKIKETSTNLADSILDICLRNSLGFFEEQHLSTWYDIQIKHALTSWEDWQSKSFHREHPLFYKCYICTKSWWNLSEFRDHILEHTTVKLDIEKYTQHECNIIAFKPNKRPDEIKEFFTEGLCYHCGKDYSKHQLSARDDKNCYMNTDCLKRFPTCTELKHHAYACKVCSIKNNEYSFCCQICTLSFGKIDDLTGHMLLMHSVKSDRPIAANYSKCKDCSEVHSSSMIHTCGNKEADTMCPYCFKSFSNKSLILDHISRSTVPWHCKICSEEVKWSCTIHEHLLTHTDKYMFVKICVKCEGIHVFLDDREAKLHMMEKHGYNDFDRNFLKIPVPVSCIYSDEEKCEQEETLQDKFSQTQNVGVFIPNPESVFRRVSILKRSHKQQKIVLKPQESILKLKSLSDHSESVDSKANILIPALNEQNSVFEKQENATENVMDIVKVKEEPIDSDDSSNLVIKEEPMDFDYDDYAIQDNTTNTIQESAHADYDEDIVKSENSEYEDDIIKLNINIEDILAKQESSRVFAFEPDSKIKSEPAIDTNIEVDKDSILEPEVIISQEGEERKRLYGCSKCPFKGKQENYLRHITLDCLYSTVGNRKKFICVRTGQFYKTIKKYLLHFLEHGYEPLCCPDCSKQFHTYSKLGSHVLGHVKQNFVRIKKISERLVADAKPEYQCRKCLKIVILQEYFQHWESHICDAKVPEKKEVVAAPRLVTDMSETAIQECIKTLQRKPKDCVYCKRRFQRVNECKRHVIEHLLMDAYTQKQILGLLKCQICQAGYPTPEKYKQHMRNHASLPVYKCELCDRTFSDSSNFTKHKKVHNLKVIICDLCGKKFQSKAKLAVHIEQHETTSPLACDKCDKVFYFESGYRRHVKNNHERIGFGYPCVICNLRFSSLKYKWDHMWEVHKERKHKADCPICFKSFRKYSDVRAHTKLVHQTEVSVLRVKNASKTVSDIQLILNNSDIKIGEAETLVIVDDDDS